MTELDQEQIVEDSSSDSNEDGSQFAVDPFHFAKIRLVLTEDYVKSVKAFDQSINKLIVACVLDLPEIAYHELEKKTLDVMKHVVEVLTRDCKAIEKRLNETEQRLYNPTATATKTQQ